MMKNSSNTSILLDVISSYVNLSKPRYNLTNDDINYCIQYGLGPILADTYLKYDELTFPEQKQYLQSIKLTAKYYAANHNTAIEEILNHTAKQSIKVTLLKGIHLSNAYYEYPHLRLMGDIDFLVENTHINKVSTILRSLGYIQKSNNPDKFYNTHQHLKPFYNAKTDIWVEVHTRLFASKTIQGKRELFQATKIYDNLNSFHLKSKHVYTLNAETNLHYTITHWIKEFKISTSLIQLVDILSLMKNENIDWNKFINGINTPVHATEVKLAFHIIKKYKLFSIPTNINKILSSKKDTMGVFGSWLLHRICYGYLHQNTFITQVVGDFNCARIWDAYLRNANSIMNHLCALKSVLFISDLDNQSTLPGAWKRIKKFCQRSIWSLKHK